MPENIPHRIDTALNAVPPLMGPLRRRGRKPAVIGARVEGGGLVDQQHQTQCSQKHKPNASKTEHFATDAPQPKHAIEPDNWLHGHATDLIGHLQSWSIDLDQREANLNARIALHDRRERQFRIQRSELTQQLASGQARVDELRKQLEARTRRLAFQDRA